MLGLYFIKNTYLRLPDHRKTLISVMEKGIKVSVDSISNKYCLQISEPF